MHGEEALCDSFLACIRQIADDDILICHREAVAEAVCEQVFIGCSLTDAANQRKQHMQWIGRRTGNSSVPVSMGGRINVNLSRLPA